ncbi:MAG: benzoate-CoA ligase family protein [Deltaproteobacteria bacterium]|nr:benzoate-CoA ligase family protein [Deltaproteobacteria bacterium]
METEETHVEEQLNVASYFLEHNMEAKGQRVAIYYDNLEYTYKDVLLLTNQMGNALKSLGVEPENRVYMVLSDSPEFVACYYAALKIGAIPSIGYTFFSPKDYQLELNNIRPKVVVANVEFIDRLRDAIRHCRYPKNLLLIGNSMPTLQKGEVDLSTRMNRADDSLEAEPTHKDDIAIWGFSGGTTGLRKIIPHRHYSLAFAYEAYNKIVRYTEEDIILPVPKLFFGYGRTGSILYPFRVGAAAVLFQERSTPERIFDFIEKYRPSILINTPTMIRKMLEVAKGRDFDLSCLRLTMSAGEALSAQLYHEWVNRFGSEIVDGVGSGELFYNFTLNIPGKVVPGSVGKPLPGYEVKIVDDEGHELPDGEVGVLIAKGGSAGTHYLRNYEKTKKTFRGEWVYTEDLFSKDRNGYLFFFGRRDDLLKVSGYFVSPTEIEACLGTHPDVALCAVVGVRDEDGLDKTKAFVVLRKGLTGSEAMADELKIYTKEKLSPHKYPRIIEFVSDLPMTRTGKVDRRKLKNQEKG